jgi:hypothetical protein
VTRGTPTLLLGLALLVASGPGRAADRTSEYVSFALRGDLRPARALLLSVAPESLTARERALAESFRARFVERTEEAPLPDVPPFARDVVAAYRSYWTAALLGDADSTGAEALLRRKLAAAWTARGDVAPADSEIVERTGDRLDQEGLHHLGGRTLPLLELMLWAREDTTRYEVQLTDGVQPVEVVFVRDFLVKGWADWATFSRASTGGWATSERLFCLGDDYDLGSEKFLVSYLRHEGRHFADYRKFPKLEQTDLEYRAKLTELAFADTSLAALIENFAASAAFDAAAPHSYANACVVRDVGRELFGEDVTASDGPRWSAVPRDAVHAAARTLLERHTARLVAAGADSVRGVLFEASN